MNVHPLVADSFANDPQCADGMRMILDALGRHQQTITGVHPPRADSGEHPTTYADTIKQFSEARGGSLFYPYLGSGMGHGCLVELADGSVKYDMIGGIGVHAFGHCHPIIVRACLKAALQNTVMQGNLQQNIDSAKLAATFLDTANQFGAELAHCFLTTSGATANENALKLAFHKKRPADRVLAFDNCFMGRTMALAHVTDRAKYRVGIPQTMRTDYLPFHDFTDPVASRGRAVAMLKTHIARYPGRHAAICLELIQGEGGYYAGDRDFFCALIDIAREHEIAVLVDEVQTFGRTTRPFAFQHFGLNDVVDIVTVGKMTQCCATLFGESFKPAPGLVSQTFTGATSSIYAAQAILNTMNAGDYFGEDGRIMRHFRHFAARLERIAANQNGAVAGPYGLGGMIAFTPFDGSPDVAKRVITELFDRGVIAFVAGSNPTRVRFLPPMGCITGDDIDTVCDILEQTVADIVAQI